jgi:hypothetical protein
MGWEQRGNGRYYYSGRRDNGRVVKRYIGCGRLAAAAAGLAAHDRQRRADDRAEWADERQEMDAIDAPLSELNALADLVVRAAMLAAGFRRHHRSEWRKSRVRIKDAA